MKLRLAKCWQEGKQSLLWQLQIFSESYPKKSFLRFQTKKQKQAYIAPLPEKPAGKWDGKGNFASLFRKYIPTCTITSIFVDDKEGRLWLVLNREGREYYLLVIQRGAVEILLMNAQLETLCRLGVKGVFTKKSPSGYDFNKESLRDIKDEFLIHLKQDGSETKSELETPESVDISPFQRDARKRLVRRVKTIRKSKEKLESLIPSEEEIGSLNEKGRWLQTFAYKASFGDSELVLSSEETGQSQLTIPLDPQVSIGQNLELYFAKVKKKKKQRIGSLKQLQKLNDELDKIERVVNRFSSELLDENEIESLLAQFSLSSEKQKTISRTGASEALPYRLFYSATGRKLLVGKGSRENDELVKLAKANDFWFHVVAGNGSHVIVPRERKETALDPVVKREAAILALHFSRYRNDYSGEVYASEKRHITKQKNMPPGLWAIRKSDSYALQYTETELKELLGRTQANS